MASAAAAAAAARKAPVIALSGSSSPSLSLSPARSKLHMRSSFLTCTRTPANSLADKSLSVARVTCFKRDWLRRDLSVIGFALIGWIAPSSIPAINGESLTGLFFKSIGTELSHFPAGPALNSPFWLWMVTWHIGLFLALTFGQIGFKGRRDGYF